MIKVKYALQFLRRNRKQGQHLRKALRGRWQKSFGEPRKAVKRLGLLREHELNAHNPNSRAKLFRALAGNLARTLAAKPPLFIPQMPVYFVTVIDHQQVVYPDESDTQGWEGSSLAEIRQAYAEALIGSNYVGLLDVALYVSAQRTHGLDRFMLWHVHLLVWGMPEAKLKQFCEDIRIGMRALLSYATSVHCQRVRDRDLLQMVWYTTKAPRKQYQLWKRRRTETLKQYKRDINGVNAVRVWPCRTSRSTS
jgi:hypothetical protein